jgi:hypothetical protein
MFIDKAVVILAIAVGVAWVIANLIVAFHYSLKWMVDIFWKDQKVMGKIGSTIFYSLAWVLVALKSAIVFALYFLCTPIYKFFKWFVLKKLHPLFVRAKTLDL